MKMRPEINVLRDSLYLFFRDALALLRPTIFLLFLLGGGVAGYYAIEGWDFISSLYMTVITVTTVGFGEVEQLSTAGRLFTIALILGGVVFYGLAIDGLLKVLISRSFRNLVEEARMRDKIRNLNNHIIICGGGRMSLALARELDRSGQSFVVLDSSPDSAVMQLRKAGKVDWPVLERDALLEESLLEVSIDKARGLASVLPTDADNLFVVLSARRLNPEIRIETRIARESSHSKMLQAGADKVLSPYAVSGFQMARSLVNPDVDNFMEVMIDRANYEFEMKVHRVQPGDSLIGKNLHESDMRSEGLLAVGVRLENGEMVFVPDSQFKVQAGMQILLLGSGKSAPLD
ncbi:MAG: potassium channel family protein [bacterium]|nr:potassium channel family protein [bacterium]